MCISKDVSGGGIQRNIRRAPQKVCRDGASRGVSGGRLQRCVGRQVCQEGIFRGVCGRRRPHVPKAPSEHEGAFGSEGHNFGATKRGGGYDPCPHNCVSAKPERVIPDLRGPMAGLIGFITGLRGPMSGLTRLRGPIPGLRRLMSGLRGPMPGLKPQCED